MSKTKLVLENEHFYSLQEVAKLLRVSERSIFRYIHGGRLKAIKIGYWRINGKDLASFLTENSNEREYIKVHKKQKKIKHRRMENKKICQPND